MAEPCVLSNFDPRLDLPRTREPIAETNPSQLMALPDCSRPSASQQIDPREKWRLAVLRRHGHAAGAIAGRGEDGIADCRREADESGLAGPGRGQVLAV